jgi:uncharacterized membrane protein YkvA (DUF1232 family)
MARLGRKAAFMALWNALVAARRGPSLGRRLAALPRMIFATLAGRYDGKARLATMLFATAYIASPVDLVPEAFLLFFGLIDDAAVAIWLAGAVLSETERFLEWERRRATVISGHATAR